MIALANCYQEFWLCVEAAKKLHSAPLTVIVIPISISGAY